jgi:hypothetical protein
VAVQPLAPREGRRVDGPYEGVPPIFKSRSSTGSGRTLRCHRARQRLRTQGRASWTHWRSVCASHLTPRAPLWDNRFSRLAQMTMNIALMSST